MSYDLGFIITFVVLFITYFLIFWENGGIKISNLGACLGISLMFASAWQVVLWSCSIAFALGIVIGICQLIERFAFPAISRFGNVRLRVF